MTTAPVEYELDYHKKIELEEAPMAARLAEYIVSRFPVKRVTDFGCSTGIYVRELRNRGNEAIGIDSSRAAIDHCVCNFVEEGDITDHCHIEWACDLGLCIEVAEHIPQEKADDLARCLVRHSRKWLIFSAAVPGQGGLGHVNLQERGWWIEKFERRGWIVDYVETRALIDHMRTGYVMGWFLNNAMVLRPMRRS